MNTFNDIKRKTIAKPRDDTKKWNTKKIEQWIYNSYHNIKNFGPSPFFEDNFRYRKGDINFEVTEEEYKEIERCMIDIEYFVDKYCYAMTDQGVQKINLYPYQRDSLKCFQNNRYVIYVASRQIGKTIVSAFYIMWYVCFNSDRNVLVVANKEETTKEIIKKIQTVYDNLPYFLKPGLLTRNVKSLEFDNGCRIVGQSTTPTAGVSFTIHLLYADEFAHVPETIKKEFYRSVIPTLSSSQISQVIITSTPNGQDLFYKLYSRAVPCKESNNEIKKTQPFVSLITYWDAPPNRDESFKTQQIELLGGSLEAWNQEFECSFLKTDDLFLDSSSIKFLNKIKTNYIHKEIAVFENKEIDYSKLTWDKNFNIDNITDKDKFVISIDTSDGIGKDYFVINIFKLEPLSLAKIKKLDEYIDETDFFRLKQVGLFYSNQTSIDEVMNFLNILLFNFFSVEQIRIILEMNFKGELIYNNIKRHNDFYPELFVHTKHSEKSETLLPGLRLNKRNKNLLVNKFRGLFKQRKIIFNEAKTIEEAKTFGITKKGTFTSQSGHDDLIMSCINLSAFFNTKEQVEMIEDLYDFIDDIKQNIISEKIDNLDSEDSDFIYYNLIKEYQ